MAVKRSARVGEQSDKKETIPLGVIGIFVAIAVLTAAAAVFFL
jgi:hypothetical protein